MKNHWWNSPAGGCLLFIGFLLVVALAGYLLLGALGGVGEALGVKDKEKAIGVGLALLVIGLWAWETLRKK